MGRKAVAEHGGAGPDFAFDEAADAGCGEIVDRLQADAARIALRTIGDVGLVDLN